MRMEYQLGQFLKSRYIDKFHLIGPPFNHSQVSDEWVRAELGGISTALETCWGTVSNLRIS